MIDFSRDYPQTSKTLLDLQGFGFLQITLGCVCNYVNTAAYLTMLKGLPWNQRIETSPHSAGCLD